MITITLILITFAIVVLFLNQTDLKREDEALRDKLRWKDDEMKELRKQVWENFEWRSTIERHLKVESHTQPRKMILLDKS